MCGWKKKIARKNNLKIFEHHRQHAHVCVCNNMFVGLFWKGHSIWNFSIKEVSGKFHQVNYRVVFSVVQAYCSANNRDIFYCPKNYIEYFSQTWLLMNFYSTLQLVKSHISGWSEIKQLAHSFIYCWLMLGSWNQLVRLLNRKLLKFHRSLLEEFGVTYICL